MSEKHTGNKRIVKKAREIEQKGKARTACTHTHTHVQPLKHMHCSREGKWMENEKC